MLGNKRRARRLHGYFRLESAFCKVFPLCMLGFPGLMLSLFARPCHSVQSDHKVVAKFGDYFI